MTPIEWLLGRDTGTSSCTILAVMTGSAVCGSAPSDPSDFGRCYRLLNHFPEWKPRMHEVSARFPEWSALVREWDNLTELYEEEIQRPDGRAPKLYARMRELVDEGRLAAGWTQPAPGCWVSPGWRKRQESLAAATQGEVQP